MDRPLLVVDLDDTLIRSRSDRAIRLVDALTEFGVEVDHTQLDTLWGRPFRELAIGLAPDVEGRYSDFIAAYCALLRQAPPTLCPGVGETVDILRVGFRCVVHTASHSELARTDLEVAGLAEGVEDVIGSDRQLNPKPSARSGYELATLLTAAGFSTAVGCYVGDALTDAAVAASAGLPLIAVTYGASSRADWLSAGVDEGRLAATFPQALEIASAMTRS